MAVSLDEWLNQKSPSNNDLNKWLKQMTENGRKKTEASFSSLPSTVDTTGMPEPVKYREHKTQNSVEIPKVAAKETGIGRYGKGNIDLYNRPSVANSDGSTSTVRSMSFNDNGREVLIPTVINKNGRWQVVSDAEAIDHYKKTGEYLGKFDSAAQANEYAQRLHNQQETLYANGKSPVEDLAAQAMIQNENARGNNNEPGKKNFWQTLESAGNNFMNYLQQPLATLDLADLAVKRKIAELTGKEVSQYDIDRAHDIQNSIAAQAEKNEEGTGNVGRQFVRGAGAVGNIVGTTLFGEATGIPGALRSVVAPAATAMQGTEAALGATAKQRATALGTRFAGNILGDVASGVTNAEISAQSGIQTYDTAIQSGATEKEAIAAGTASAAAEYFSNKLFAGTPLEDATEESGYVTDLIESAIKKTGKQEAYEKIMASFGGRIARAVFDKAGEGVEEVVTGFIDPLVEKLTYNPEKDLATAEELWDEFIGGVTMSLIMGVGEKAIGAAGTAEALIDNTVRAASENKARKQTNSAIDNAYQSMQQNGLFSQRATQDAMAARALMDAERSRQARGQNAEQNLDQTVQAVNNYNQRQNEMQAGLRVGYTNVENPQNVYELSTPESINSAIESKETNNGRVSNSAADKVIADADAMQMLGITLADLNGKNTSEVRNLVRERIDGLANQTQSGIIETRNAEEGAYERRGTSPYGVQGQTSMGAGESGTGLAGNAESTGARRPAGTESAGRSEAGAVQETRFVSAQQFGAKSAASEADIRRFVRRLNSAQRRNGEALFRPTPMQEHAAQTQEETDIASYAEKHGVKVHFYTGDFFAKDKGGVFRVRGYISADGTEAWIKTDHGTLTARQIFMHEDYHRAIKQNKAIKEDGIRRLKERYKDDPEGLKKLVDEYAALYSIKSESLGSRYEEYVLEEILCDAHAGIEVSVTTETGTEAVDFSTEANAALEANGAGETENGDRFSRETDEFRRNFSGAVSAERGVRLTNAERKFISSEVKSGRGKLDADGLGGRVSNAQKTYLFDTIGDGVVVNKVVDTQTLNVHERSVDIGRESRNDNTKSGTGTEKEKGGQRYQREHISASRNGEENAEDDRLASEERRDGERNLREVEGDSEDVDYSPDYAYWRTLMKEGDAAPPQAETSFSREFDEKYMAAAEKKNSTGKLVSAEVMEQAKKDRAEIKKIMEPISDMLPADITGNTFYSDSSYGGSQESTTVCPRSLAYEEFMDAVAEELGRPLTVEDTVFISQEAMALTDKPECLYCYVAMDRKAYREALGSYIEQRDTFLKNVKDGMEVGLVETMKKADAKAAGVKRSIGKDTAYGILLNGRDNTANMYNRAKLWLEDGKKITKKDLASIASMNRAAQDPALKAQINDAQAYAQAASWAKKKNGYAAYNNHILRWSKAKVEKLNKHYGMRMYSFSDYSPAFVLENMQMLTDASVKGLKVLSYTKELDYVRIFAPTGMNINISVFGYTDFKTGNVAMDAMQGADWAQAQELRKQYPNVGCTFVATSDAQVEWALAQDWIDVVIPFHIVRTGGKVANMFGWKNYTDMSADRKNPNWTPENAASIYPSEHQNDKDLYLELCEENNLTPRFEKWVDNPNYMKLVNETRQSDAETNPVQPVFDMDAAKASIDEMVKRGGYMQHIGGTSENMQTLAKETAEKIQINETGEDFYDSGASEVKFSRVVEDEKTLDFLNDQKTIKTYKTMQVVDGNLYPPMASRINGKFEDPSILGQWEQSTEHPELIKSGNKFKLDKGKGQGSIEAAYNPYMHSSNLVVNDQFSGAYTRDNLVTVECEVPVSEETSGYHAEFAKDSVGWHPWHTGTVAGQIRKAKGIERQVFLSRWIKPVRIVPDSEVASMYKELLDGTDIAVPDNVVTPMLLAELKKAGVKTTESGRVKNGAEPRASREPAAKMTTSRIDYLIEDSGAGKSKTYAQKWITSINPTDFLNLTLKEASQNRDDFDNRPGDYGETVNDGNYVDYLKKETRQTPFLEIYRDGTVAGHEGRHRMRALEKSGVTSAEVVVMFVDDDGRLLKSVNNVSGRLETLKQLNIKNQYGTGQTAKIRNVIPLNLDHRDEILSSYGEDTAEDGDVRYSRDIEYAELAKDPEKNEAELQKMVDERAKEAGYNTETPLYHGTGSFGFTEFDLSMMDDKRSIFTTDKANVAESYSGKNGARRIYEAKKAVNRQSKPSEIADALTASTYGDSVYVAVDSKEKARLLREKRSDIEFYINDIMEFYADNEGMFNEDKTNLLLDIREDVENIMKAKTPEDVDRSLKSYTDHVWDMKWMDEDVQMQLFASYAYAKGGAPLNELINKTANRIASLLADGDAYICMNGPFYGNVMSTEQALSWIASSPVTQPGIYKLYGNKGRSISIDCNGSKWNRIDGRHIGQSSAFVTTREVSEWAQNNGYDSVTFRDIVDIGSYSNDNTPSDVTIFFSPTQVKSADPVTYNDNGEVIPLSERFNPENNDIRFSREIEDLQNRLDRTREQLREARADRDAKVDAQKLLDEMYYGRKMREMKSKGDEKAARQMQSLRERLKEAKAQGKLALEIQKIESTTRYNEAMRAMREDRDAKITALKTKFEQQKRQTSEQRKAKETADKIQRHVKKLSDMLLNPNDKKHIMVEMQQPVAAFLASINTERSYSYDLTGKLQKDVIGAPTKRSEKARALKEAYKKIAGTATIDPNLIGTEDAEGLLDTIASYGDVPLTDMTSEQLQNVWECVKAVEASVQKANKAFAMARFETVRDIADAMAEDNGGKKAATNRRKFADVTFKFMNLDNAKPVLFFHRFGKTGDALWKSLRNAQDKSIQIFDAAAKFTNNLLDINTLHAANLAEDMKDSPKLREWESDEVKVVLGGKERTLTTAQLMELYVLMQRPQARDHILKGGIRLDDVKRGSRTSRMVTPIRGVNEMELGTAFDKLTKEQKHIADQLQKYASTTLSNYGNEASREVYGYDKFREEVYWPIRTNNQETQTDVQKATMMSSIANIGMTKQTVPNAKNSVMVGSVFDTFSSHVTDMAKYAAYLGVSEDMRRLRNYQFFDAEIDADGKVQLVKRDGELGSMQELIDNVQGVQGSAYWDNLMQHIATGVTGKKVASSPFSSFASNYKRASVMSNLRVVIQQPTAIYRAMSMMDAKYLIKGMKSPMKGWNTAVKYCPICTWKDWGYFDTETGREMKDVFFNTASTADQIADAGMKLAGKADSIAWGQLWNAVEAETEATHKDVKPGSEEYYKICEDRFNEIIDRTQVVDGILQRSQIMRSDDGINKMATSFMAEPTTQLNMIMMAAYDHMHGGDMKFGRTLKAVTIAGLLNAMAQSVIDALRDDDKDKEYWRRWLESLTGITGDEESFKDYAKGLTSSNLFDSYNPLGMIPYIKDVVSIAQGFSVDRMDVESISDVINAFNAFTKACMGKGQYTIAGATTNLLMMIGKATGFGVYNLKRDLYDGIFQEIIAAVRDYQLRYQMLKFMKNIDVTYNRAAFYDLLYAAKQNDSTAYRRIRSDMIDSGVKESSIDAAMKKRAE